MQQRNETVKESDVLFQKLGNTWYVFTPDSTGTYIFSTCSLNTCDTKIWIYTDCPDTVNESPAGTYAFNDNANCGLQADMQRFVQQLHLNGRLTPSFVLRALCQGEVRLVEHAFAELSGIAHNKAWLLVHDGGAMGLRAVFERSGMPPSIYPAFRAAIDVLHETEFDGSREDRIRFRKRMIERVLTRFQSIPQADLDYLLEKLDYAREETEQDRQLAFG